MRRRFATLDVFTDRRFAGNPLAVVRDADDLDPAAMQAIARELNLSETVFVLPPVAPGRRARLRIFTPASELPFAGHPTVGTAVLLGLLDGGADARELVLEEEIGPVRCRVEPIDHERGRAWFELPRLPEPAGSAAAAAVIARALGIGPDEIGCQGFVPGCWSAGVPLTLVPLRGLSAIGRCRPDLAHWQAAFEVSGRSAAYLFCRETVTPGHSFHARMFAPHLGIAEDPATGSAAAAFAGLLAAHGNLADGDHVILIEQGLEMGRPSLIELSMSMQGGKLTAAAIGGGAIAVSEGTIEA
jgi:trans-2,3-dihydro-3-hydroxyanthranilate isomerase